MLYESQQFYLKIKEGKKYIETYQYIEEILVIAQEENKLIDNCIPENIHSDKKNDLTVIANKESNNKH